MELTIQATKLEKLDATTLSYQDATAAKKVMALDVVESVRMPNGRYANMGKLRENGTLEAMEVLEVKLADGTTVLTPGIVRFEDGKSLRIGRCGRGL